ncbi:MAG: serine hydroxymethyltransferase [Candidatus Colwellbacteria bacterium]|jgi:glycine hydroxymethyltransferase|nr:serine hydroxymethyltransferase [Candidatus Colwellbacteria bacterium]MCK9497251.1 serine hydroxymethyltransferase [Candidatus Colwellbacteria bacterium]MDD3752393.1 serine hydroxymethyltransferase [Candidatus Colwellbacteria bacterium]MDD4818642.1 serine hydroxymethyltransferase [Candidatus Colwellbacteria bacterium]
MMDKKLEKLIKRETKRQEETIDLIPSENIMPSEIMFAIGSPLANKYSEGYPGKRYYPGNNICDEIEILAQERALEAFGLDDKKWAVNVQPYSGSPANLAVYLALMNPREKLMGMELSSGGHLTHGHKVSATGKIFCSVQYGLGKNGRLDYEAIEKIALKEKPKAIVSGTTAYPRKISFKKFGDIAQKIGAYHIADISHIAGLVLAGEHPSPFEYAQVVTMTTHKTLRGPRGAVIFSRREPLIAGKGNINEAIDKAVFPGLQGGPHNNQTAAIAQSFYEAGKASFRNYQKKIINNSKALADGLKARGFKLVTGGTDNHLILADLRNFEIKGKDAETRLEENGIIANRNSIPGDKSPFNPSGLRMGTPAVTTRGMKTRDMEKIADMIYRVIAFNDDVKNDVKNLIAKYPVKSFVNSLEKK